MRDELLGCGFVVKGMVCRRELGQAEVMTVPVQPVFQETDGSQEAVALQHQEFDINSPRSTSIRSTIWHTASVAAKDS